MANAKYRVSGTLNHGVLEPDPETGKKVAVTHVYHDGDEFETDDPKLEAELRALHTILLPEEYAALVAEEGNKGPLEQLAAQRQAVEDENAQLKARIAELEAAANASKGSGKGGDSK